MKTPIQKRLLVLAKQARKHSYAPYSHFKVGAALLGKSGRVYTGCNIENSSYSATVCAERVALFQAVSGGEKEFKALAIAANPGTKPWPCGVCRQVLGEFAPGIDIWIQDGKKLTHQTLHEIFPEPFLL